MTISLRNLPPEVERAILEKSRQEGISLDEAATQLLIIAANPAGKSNGFEEFFGTWSAVEAAEFDATLASMRQIDSRDWA